MLLLTLRPIFYGCCYTEEFDILPSHEGEAEPVLSWSAALRSTEEGGTFVLEQDDGKQSSCKSVCSPAGCSHYQ